MIDVVSVCCAGEVMIELAPGDDAHTYRQDFAGDTYNTAVYLARAGHRVSYMTRLGDDEFSSAALGRMREEGIDTGLVEIVPGALPGLYMIGNDVSGERRFSYWRENSPARDLFDVAHRLSPPTLFYFSGITLAVTARGLDNLLATLEHLRVQGAKTAFDPNYRPALWSDRDTARAHYESVLPLCDTVLATQEDDVALWGIDDPVASQALYLGTGVAEVVIKGSGLVAHARNAETHCVRQAEPVQAVDTTGAGDSFNAGYLCARLEGHGLDASVQRAQALAARVVQCRGAIIPRDSAGS